MGFYFRKSISVGPLRFNLSKSGVGVSAGIKGLRFGTGPRGNYVHMGRGGLYYRATIPSQSSKSKQTSPSENLQPSQLPVGGAVQMHEIESADVSQIVDTSSRELLKELNEKQQTGRFFPKIAIASGVFLFLALVNGMPFWLWALLAAVCGVGAYYAYNRDIMSKTVVLFYDFDSDLESVYAQFHEVALRLTTCSSAWHIAASGAVRDSKYHGGAGSLVNRKKTSISKSEPPFVKTNIETLAIGVGRQTLHFFPDRVLVYDTNGVGAVNYSDLNIMVEPVNFIESESVPNDARVVDKTWQYVNKSGGPDRRFKDNRELPVCLYEKIHLTSKTGLNELVMVSRSGFGEKFAESILGLAKQVPSEAV